MNQGGWIRNPRYPAIPGMRVIPAGEVPELGIRHGREIYRMVSGREELLYLNFPKGSPECLYQM
ncbi:Glucose-6-phosphate isomerase, archaeal (fragment) [Methanoculleus bourgensis]|uniref:Glucose-6-phosphate isomerase, archaeal n=1 Tax=Methanoculleus bourgensis TaxID=83986 RepID=A0A0X3BPJ3_9EURY